MLSDLRKIAGAAELAGTQCILHGHHGMDLVGSLQVEATIPSARMKEIVFTTPGILPVSGNLAYICTSALTDTTYFVARLAG